MTGRTEHDPKKYAHWLRYRRIQCGLSCRQLGRRLGLSSAMVSLYENGKTAPSPANALKIAEFFAGPDGLLEQEVLK